MPFNEDQLNDIKETFECFDKDGEGESTGFVSPAGFSSVLRALGANPTEKDLAAYHKELGKEKISFDDFLPYWEKLSKQRDSYEDIVEAFRIFDKDGQGYISVQELSHMLANMGEKFSPEEIEETVKDIDDGSGMVAYEEFVKLILG